MAVVTFQWFRRLFGHLLLKQLLFPLMQKYFASDLNGPEPRIETQWWFCPSLIALSENIFILLFLYLVISRKP